MSALHPQTLTTSQPSGRGPTLWGLSLGLSVALPASPMGYSHLRLAQAPGLAACSPLQASVLQTGPLWVIPGWTSLSVL